MPEFNYEDMIYCEKFLNANMTDQERYQETIDEVRRMVVILIKPLTSQFFYWTLLLLIMHRFNFKKPVIKIVIFHYILRTIGDILDQYGQRYTTFYHKIDGICVAEPVTKAEHHPLRWFISRQLAGIFWYSGEIVGDWYPLIRTRAVVVGEDKKNLWYIYVTCFIFNLSKIVMMLYHFTVDKDNIKLEEDNFYNVYWAIYLASLCCSLLYDSSVYIAMKRAIFKETESINFGFLKKFRNISEYRILVSAIIGLIGIPIMGSSAILRLNFKSYDWSFEDLRIFIVNTTYYMMFIDQIMLYYISKEEHSLTSSKDNKIIIV